MRLNWNFLGGKGMQNKNPSVGGRGHGYFVVRNYILYARGAEGDGKPGGKGMGAHWERKGLEHRENGTV